MLARVLGLGTNGSDAGNGHATGLDWDAVAFVPAAYLGFDPADVESVLDRGAGAAADLAALIDERTVNVTPDLDEDAFFSDADGNTTLVNRYDLEKAVPLAKKRHLREVERYWVDKLHSFVII